MLFYYVCGLFKIAVIAQQIYARYVTRPDPRPPIRRVQQVVAALGLGAVRAIDTQTNLTDWHTKDATMSTNDRLDG